MPVDAAVQALKIILTQDWERSRTLFITWRIKPMAKVCFDGKTSGQAFFDPNRDMSCSAVERPFEPVVVLKPGGEAIYEGLRLANIEGFKKTRL